VHYSFTWQLQRRSVKSVKLSNLSNDETRSIYIGQFKIVIVAANLDEYFFSLENMYVKVINDRQSRPRSATGWCSVDQGLQPAGVQYRSISSLTLTSSMNVNVCCFWRSLTWIREMYGPQAMCLEALKWSRKTYCDDYLMFHKYRGPSVWPNTYRTWQNKCRT